MHGPIRAIATRMSQSELAREVRPVGSANPPGPARSQDHAFLEPSGQGMRSLRPDLTIPAMTGKTIIREAEDPVQAKLVLDDDESPEHPQRATLNLWVPPPAGLTKAAEEEAVRRAAITFLERALETLRSAPPMNG